MSKRATLTFTFDEVSHIVGLLRIAIDETEEMIDDDMDADEVKWARARGEVLSRIESRFVAAGRKLQRETRGS